MFFSLDYLIYMLPAFILMLLAQWWVSSTYQRWSRIPNAAGISGAEAAQRLLRYGGLMGVGIEPMPGQLSDNYDPRTQTLRLSSGVAQGSSVASLAITAHEIGHALQDKQGYVPMRLRSMLVPAVSIGSNLGWILILAGLLLQGMLGTQLATSIAWLGVAAFSMGAVFALATLPVELNASSRARVLLKQAGLVQSERESNGVGAVLTAAAFTYVAGLATALLQLLYYVSLVSGMGGRRRA